MTSASALSTLATSAINGLHFTWIDWFVVFGYLALTTWVGHVMRGKQATIRDFFLAGRTLPWQAVSGSIIATEISGVTFIGVPGMIYALNGNWTYLQWAIGSIIARCLVGMFFVKFYYEKEIYSPYDFMANRLGAGLKRLATGLFFLGSILGQSVRVLVAALALDAVTPMSFTTCIWIIGAFAIVWTLMGGMQTVIWTDVMQFFLFVIGGVLALVWMIHAIPGGWAGIVDAGKAVPEAGANGKFTLFSFVTDPKVEFTLWVALIAVPFQNMFAFGVDQLSAQRMFCCRGEHDARKAIIWSSFGQLITVLMMTVGVSLFVFYQTTGSTSIEAWKFAQSGDYVFPVWITSELPIGVRGLILAGIFAAAISSLDSILAALSQTTLSLFVDTTDEHVSDGDHHHLLRWSRILVVTWGLGLSAFAIVLDQLRGNVNMVQLAFGMIAYTTGPMLGLFFASLLAKTRRVSMIGLTIGVIASVAIVACFRMEVWTIAQKTGHMSAKDVAGLPTMTEKKTASPLVQLDASFNGEALYGYHVTAELPSGELTVDSIEPIGSEDAKHQIAKLTAPDTLLSIEVIDKAKALESLPLVTEDAPLWIKGVISRTTDGTPRLLVKGAANIAPATPDAAITSDPEELRQLLPHLDGQHRAIVTTGPTPKIGFAWFYPLTTLLTLGCGLLIPGGHSKMRESA
ncbi:sodium:solute symporter family transporter [Sulfuriroseicoccus oceanibius]|uniref:Na+/solute symporter n=1 Tax=Sulfuriroseicoccus oceanibius TaxID=2707525 RepID=A0A6B3LDL4_9BACT|nr:hypothetical protein [Sulfuriroseicoccus oceanibius]QQL45008.1 hypothetical protein G3M56_014275 [Sulfuriroseicoccus oceanibius]